MQNRVNTHGTAKVNGAELYYERRGGGPPVLFISGATGDAEHFDKVAELLADEFTVVTYDRRGNSRSPRPAGWTATSMDEQADDAAGLLRALDLAPAAVFGTSGGAVILLNLPVLPNAAKIGAQLQAMTEEALAKGGSRGAMETFVRANAGDASFEHLDSELRQRMLANGEVFFPTELEAFVSYVPEATALAGVKIPVQVMAGADNRGVYYYEAAKWVADRLGTDLKEMPGGHAPYLDRPREMVNAIRPFLRRVS
jgi:pimeloyl-ACP methyl ester carboxylesterase